MSTMDDQSQIEVRSVLDDTLQSTFAPLYGLADKQAGKIKLRISRIASKLDGMLMDQSVAKGIMSVYYLLEGLLQDGKMELMEGSPFADAMQKLLITMDSGFQKKDLDGSARKKSLKLRKTLISEGYFI